MLRFIKKMWGKCGESFIFASEKHHKNPSSWRQLSSLSGQIRNGES